MADEREWKFVPKARVAKMEADGWVDTGESPEHHSGHSHMMYRYVDPPKANGDLRVKASTARAEGREIVVSHVTEHGFIVLRYSADTLASHIGRCVRAMSDLV